MRRLLILSLLALALAPACGELDPIASERDLGRQDGGGDDLGASDLGDASDGLGTDTGRDDVSQDTGGSDAGTDSGGGGGDAGADAGPTIEECEANPSLPGCERPTADDRDGDGIVDRDEGNCAVDTDVDGTPDCQDIDSDDDGIPDRTEAGDRDPATPPVDSDGDRVADFRDSDSDDDGIPDSAEGSGDPDRDGDGNWVDTDADGDLIRDATEGTTDSDSDGVPDYLDEDSDNDFVPDWFEGFSDTDSDGVPDRLDTDSDDDGILDRIEAGDEDLVTPPIDTDGDELADFQDFDSDGDGLLDELELGCPASSNRLIADTDGDGYSDLAEYAVGSDPCNALWVVTDEVEFFFFLPLDVEEDAPLEFATDVQQADVHFNMDTTASMNQEIANLRSGISGNVIPGVGRVVANTAFGVSSFRDFPIGSFGDSGDYPFRLNQRVTTRASDAQAGTTSLISGGGDDFPESGWESLYQIATGAGGVSWGGGSIAAFNPVSGRIVGVADGTIGGVGFREGSLPIVVHITDATSHNASDYSGNVTGAHSYAEASSALRAIRARAIGIASGAPARAELRNLAVATNAVVPPCAFAGACGAGSCCTAIGGGAESPESGVCPLVFQIDADGTGLSDRVVDAIEFLATAASIDVSTRVVRDEAVFAAEGVDTSCFIRSVVPVRAESTSTCAGSPTIADINPVDGVNDTFRSVTPGSRVFFDVNAKNEGCFEPTDRPRAFDATIEVLGDGVTVLDSLRVTIIIPPIFVEGEK
jgi:hypothetical protein